MKELYGRDLASKQDYDNAETSARIARANYDLAATNLGYALIIAPFSGIITRRFLDPGALVSPGNTTLFTLMDLDQVKVVISVLEKDIPSVTPGKEAIVTVDAYPGRRFTGTIKRLSEAVDPDTRTMPVEIDILNSDHTLKPGMFASVTFIVDRREGAITVPVTAILKDNQGPYLFTVRSDTARKVRIVPGVEQDSTVEILSGISDTTMKIITTGQQFARDGNPVAVQ
jgi:membrane fusion protein (multidrug efflux system)